MYFNSNISINIIFIVFYVYEGVQGVGILVLPPSEEQINDMGSTEVPQESKKQKYMKHLGNAKMSWMTVKIIFKYKIIYIVIYMCVHIYIYMDKYIYKCKCLALS